MTNESKKILVVEDDTVTRRIIVKAMETMGHTTIQASDGLRAFDILQDNPDISLIITDLLMAKMGGRELVNVLRSNELFKKLPIIMVSGIVPLRDITEILSLGASRFLPKPLNTEELKQYVRQLLNQNESDTDCEVSELIN